MYQGEYQLVGSEMGFFSRKLEPQLSFQNIPWRWQFKTQDRTQKRLNLARLHAQNELCRLGADKSSRVQALFAGRGILEYYLG